MMGAIRTVMLTRLAQAIFEDEGFFFGAASHFSSLVTTDLENKISFSLHKVQRRFAVLENHAVGKAVALEPEDDVRSRQATHPYAAFGASVSAET